MATKKAKSDPIDTRMRQLLTETLLEMVEDDDFTAKERAEVVDACMAEYQDALLLNAQGFLALTMHDMLEDEDPPPEEKED